MDFVLFDRAVKPLLPVFKGILTFSHPMFIFHLIYSHTYWTTTSSGSRNSSNNSNNSSVSSFQFDK